MKYLVRSLAVLSLGVVVFSCNKREIIPPPEPKVDLKNHFYGKLNGSDVELTQNVNGYTGSSEVDLIINAATLDSATYYSTFSSPQSLQKISVGHGSLVFDWGSSERPTLATFESFYLSGLNQEPDVSLNGLNGFTVTYTDGVGRAWKSNSNHSYPQESVEYNSMALESDAKGDYAKFKVSFNTYVYHTYYDNIQDIYLTDSILITDAVYTGWYKR